MSESKSLDPLFHLVHVFKQKMHENIEQLELDITPMHVRVLKIINKKPFCTAVDIATILNRDKAQVTRLMSSLIDQHYVMKEANPQDKRSQCLRLTESGEQILEKVLGVDKTLLNQMSQGISDDELDAFLSTSKRITENLAK